MSDQEPDGNNNKGIDPYSRFPGSDDEDNCLLAQLQPTKQEIACLERENNVPNFAASQYVDIPGDDDNEAMYDAFKMEDANDNKKFQKSQSIKKQIPLPEALTLIEQRIAESTTIQNKINGFKLLTEKIRQSRTSNDQIESICTWIQSIKLIDNFFHEDSHPQILRNMPTILKFLYENNRIHLEQISMYSLFGLKAHEQYLKVVQSVLGFIKVQDLCQVFNLICQENDLENHNLVSLLSNIVSNKYFFEESLTSADGEVERVPQRNILREQYEIVDHVEINVLSAEVELKQQIQSAKQATKTLTLNLFKFLVGATATHMNTYYPILNKLITSKHVFLSSQLCSTISQLLKNHKINGVYILEHWLKIDFGQSSKLKEKPNLVKSNFISKLVNQHLYQYLLIALTKVRFNKTVVDKILNIFILLSKNYKPLQNLHTEYIWRILGLHSKQQKERQQFFNFVKDILRNQSNFTEQSVNFIFFEVLMCLKAEWFSLKILDCLEMLFMRLNEDLKLISYADHTYEIQNHDLVGIDKFWYIYFYSNDAKVTKKCKDFLWKLTTYCNTYETKTNLLDEHVTKIIQYMSECTSDFKADFCNKGFDMIDKLMEEAPKKEATVQMIQLIVKNQCKDAIAPKKIDLKLTEKCNLLYLKEQISLAICPSNQNIKLLAKGQTLIGDKMTLRQLGLQNGNTIMVVDAEPQKQLKRNSSQNIQNIIIQITEIFGSELSQGLIKFIAQKMEDHSIDRIMEAIMSHDKLAIMIAEFEENKQKQQDEPNSSNVVHFDENQRIEDGLGLDEMPVFDSSKTMEIQGEKQNCEAKEVKLSYILNLRPEYIKDLLECASSSNKSRAWQTIKKFPHSQFYLSEIQKHVGQRNWVNLFPQQQPNEMICTYNAHLLKHIFQTNKHKVKNYMIENGGFVYLKNWIIKLVKEQNYSNIILEEITGLFAILLQEYSSLLANFAKRAANKEERNLLKIITEENFWTSNSFQNEVTAYGDEQFIKWLVDLLLGQQKQGQFPSKNITQILIYYILTNRKTCAYIVELPLPQVFRIIQIHGFPGEYIFLTALSRNFLDQSLDPNKKYSSKLLNLVDYGFDQNSSKTNIVYIYDLVTCILDGAYHHRQKEIEIVAKSMGTVSANIDNMDSQELVSILALLKLSICKIYGQDRNIQDSNQQNKYFQNKCEMQQQQMDAFPQKTCELIVPSSEQHEKQVLQIQISQFSEWLFKNYLFNLQNPGKYIRDKAIRKECYEILNLICANCTDIGVMLIDGILKLEIPAVNKDDDYIGFRDQAFLGLTNLGATCYINSLLQQLYHTKFSKLLLQKGHKQNNQKQKLKIKQLKTIFMRLCYSIKNVVNPIKFIQGMSFYGEPINTSVQQDATEFLLCLFDYIQGEGCQAEVYDVFGGFLCNQTTVDQNGPDQLVKNKQEHFNSLTIDIKGRRNLQEALAYLIKPQILDGDNKYFCQELGKKMKASLRYYIQKMPNILILTLKRFQFDYDSQSRHKLNDYFQFPFDLDMHKYSAAYLRNKEETSDSKYKLTGILVHSGSAESGHYYSYIKIGEQWFEFNDKNVYEFNINNLKSECFGCSDGKKSKSAYMLFYEKAHTSYHGVYLNQIPQSNFYKQQILDQNSIFLKTRLIYDENFRVMLEQLYQISRDSRIQQMILTIFGKRKAQKKEKEKQKEYKDGKDEGKYQEIVYFDEEEKKPLMDQDLFDEMLNRD